MRRADSNRSGDMEVFAQVVALGGFSVAAKALGMTPSAVSKLVSRLEGRLGARLLNRSTRRLQLTPEGEAFYQRALRILSDIEEAEREAAAGAAQRGHLRVNVNEPVGRHHILPLVPAFLERYPRITLDITLSDQVIDLLEARADIAVRTGPLRASRLVARKLGESRLAVVAAPAYLERHGVPQRPADLESHNRIAFNFARAEKGWPFIDGTPMTLPPAGNVLVGDGESARTLALAGVGIARLSLFHIAGDIAAGRLTPVLEAFNPGDTQELHAVFLGHGGPLPARVRALIDFLADNIQIA